MAKNKITNKWLIPNRVIFQKLSGEFTSEQSMTAGQANQKMLSEGDPPVHIIVDVSDIKLQTADMRLTDSIKATRLCLEHPAMGDMIVVGINNRIVAMFIKITGGITAYDMHTAKTLNEAIEKLIRISFDLTEEDFPSGDDIATF